MRRLRFQGYPNIEYSRGKEVKIHGKGVMVLIGTKFLDNILGRNYLGYKGLTFVMIWFITVAVVEAQTLVKQTPTVAPRALSSLGDSFFGKKAIKGWGGNLQRLEDEGISLNAQWLLEGFDNFQGGIKIGNAFASTFDLNVGLDTEKVFHWKGGKFYVDLEDHAWQDPSKDLIGDLQNFDKQNARPYFEIYELWYRQMFLNGFLHLKLGKWNANDDFSVNDNGVFFLNSSDQLTPTLLTLPTTPDTMLGSGLYLTPISWWSIKFGIFDANQSDAFGNFAGNTQLMQPTKDGLLLIGEMDLRWSHAFFWDNEGNLKLGAWHHTGIFTRLDGSSQEGAKGFYAVFNQAIWRPRRTSQRNCGVRTFVSSGWTQSSVSVINWNLAGGLTWAGFLTAPPQDVWGFSANYAHLSLQSGRPYSYELALEWFYYMRVSNWMAFIPDVQNIIHPGGRYANALVGSLDVLLQI